VKYWRTGLALLVLAALVGCGEEIRDRGVINDQAIEGAETVSGLQLNGVERAMLREDLAEHRVAFTALHAMQLSNEVRPALRFDPLINQPGGQEALNEDGTTPTWSDPATWAEPPRRPADLDDLAFASIAELGYLLRSGEVSSVELTELCLRRLEEFGPQLECVVSLTADRARDQARRVDREIAAGRWRGPLHGIPYGAKDLLAVRGTRTTWGATPYREQVIDDTATVVARLDSAGAVLVAKLTLGALAWGDVWFGGRTRNPWNLEQGSSGSSAGPAAAVAAGLLPFAIGTETWGSIVSPSTRCGVTGLRPTFGRVSRAGAMALSWSMDKIGPIARGVEDCAMVFEAIRGPDGRDPTVIAAPFPYRPEVDLRDLRIGYLADDFAEDYGGHELDRAALEVMRELGAELIPVQLPARDPEPLAFILSAEAATAFSELTLSGGDDELVRQVRYAWPNVFRAARFIPAVEYIEANRARTLLIQEMAELFDRVDVYLCPSFQGNNLLITNLSGHPQVVLPNGFVEPDAPHSFSFVGRLFDEATLLAVARAYQEATDWHHQHPPGY